jgi:hypothetical protein
MFLDFVSWRILGDETYASTSFRAEMMGYSLMCIEFAEVQEATTPANHANPDGEMIGIVKT